MVQSETHSVGLFGVQLVVQVVLEFFYYCESKMYNFVLVLTNTNSTWYSRPFGNAVRCHNLMYKNFLQMHYIFSCCLMMTICLFTNEIHISLCKYILFSVQPKQSGKQINTLIEFEKVGRKSN